MGSKYVIMNKYFTMHQKVFLFLFVFILTAIALSPYKEFLGLSLWRTYKVETLPSILNPSDAQMYYEMGNFHFGGEKYDVKLAQGYFERSIGIDKDFIEAHYQLGRIYFIQGKFRPALEEIKKTIALAPDFKKAYYMYGLISAFEGNYDEGIYGFTEFIKRDDFNWAGYNDLAWVYFRRGEYIKTKEVAEKGLKRAYRNPWLSNIYGTALLNLGEKEKAREAFQIALEESMKMTPEQWGMAYPGNNPRIYSLGLEEMRSAIKHNLELLKN